jgi:hypothetical protein
MCEKRRANKVTSSMFNQAEERAAVVRLSEDWYESLEGPHLIDKLAMFRELLAVTCASQSYLVRVSCGCSKAY